MKSPGMVLWLSILACSSLGEPCCLAAANPEPAAASAAGDVAQSARAPQIPYERYKLSNGLEVLLSEDHKLPIVAVDIWYHVGPVKERAGRTGFAHLFEHMMFEGSKHVGEKAHFRYLEAAGATDINGTTSFDRTNYFETVPSNELELALWLESDRMGFLLDSLDRARLTNQRDVVRNELRQDEGQPYYVVDEEVFHQLFPRGHPYYAYVIGSHADVEAARLTDVREFFRQYYQPNNATIAIAGDFDPATIKGLLEKYFGPLPAGPPVEVTKVVTPPITSERRAVVTDTIHLSKVDLAWLSAPAFTPGDADADIAAEILGDGKSSRMYRELVYKQQIAQSVTCYNYSLSLASIFECELIAKPDVPPAKLEAEAEKVVDGLAQSGPDAQEIEAARNKVETALISGLQVLGGFGGIADQLNYYNQYTGDPGYLPKDLARHDAVTAASVQKYVQATLGKNQRVVVYGVPGRKVIDDVPRSPENTDADVKINPEHTPEFEAAQSWRATPPKPGPRRELVLPQPAVFTLENGLQVYLVERHQLPMISAQIITLAGDGENPVSEPGLAGFTAAMLTEGTRKRSADEIARAAALLGGDLKAESTANAATLSISLLSRNISPGLDLMADSIENPVFPAADLERIRGNRLTALVQEEDDPVKLGMRAGLLSLYGPGSSYGFDSLGTAVSIRSMSGEQLTRFHDRHYGPKNSLLELTGDLTPAEARQLAEEAFGGWSSSTNEVRVPPPPETPQQKIVLVDKPGSPQTALLTFAPGIERGSPDYPAASVMNAMLGGLFSSRINMNLREEHGYTYGAFSFFRYYRGTGPFITYAMVRQDVTAPAAEQLFQELNNIHVKPLTDTELRMSKDSIIRSLPGSFESADEVNRQLEDLWLFGLPQDYYRKMPDQIEGVTSEQARAAAVKYVHPENLLLIAVGDKAKIEAELKGLRLGPVETWNEIAAEHPK